jgi:uncharacterized protein YqeY
MTTEPMVIVMVALALINIVQVIAYLMKKRQMEALCFDQRNRAEMAENKLAAVDIRDSHYPALQESNRILNAIVDGMKAELKTSESAPYGRWTGKFDKFEQLVLFLLFDADPADFRRPREVK